MSGCPTALRRIGALSAALVLAFLVVAPMAAAGAASAMNMAAPSAATLGQQVTLQARLVDNSGKPIANAVVDFVSPATFLGTSGDVVVAWATTDKTGLASATWQVRRNGALTIRAVFAGDTKHGPAQATAKMTVTGDRQLYVPQAGVQVPLLNKAPVAALAGLWPALSAWPVLAVLLTVWGLYATAVAFLYRIARSGAAESGEAPVAGDA